MLKVLHLRFGDASRFQVSVHCCCSGLARLSCKYVLRVLQVACFAGGVVDVNLTTVQAC